MSGTTPTSGSNYDWLKWTSISIVIAVTIAGLGAAIVYLKRRRDYSIEYAQASAAHEAERQRLMQLMYYLHLSIRKPPRDEPPGIWVFQPEATVPLCIHGLSKGPEEFETGYRQAFMDVCPICYPDFAISTNGEIPTNVVQLVSRHPVPYYEQPLHFGSDNKPIRVKLRRAYSKEIPKGAAPKAPHGFKTVPMVLEWA